MFKFLTASLQYSLKISNINLSSSTISLFSIKVILFVKTFCSQNIGLIVSQKILLSQIRDGFKFQK